MKTVFNSLKELQEVYGRKLKLEKEIEEIHSKAKSNKEVLSRLEQRKEKIEHQLKEILQQENLLKGQSAEAEASREKAEFRISEIKTQREYEALEKEIKNFSQQESSLRKEIEMVRVNRSETEEEADRLLELIKSQKQDIHQESTLFGEDIQNKEILLKDLTNQEQKISINLGEDLQFKFKRIVRKKDKSIVAMKGNVCTGCHMVLPNQMANDVRREERIYFCPHCSRILYFEEESIEENISEVTGGLSDLVTDLE